MTEIENRNACKVPRLLLSRSDRSTRANKTGDWRFAVPRYENKTAPCAAACPAGLNIPRIEMLAATGNLAQAWDDIMLENPLPAVCGRVCFHPCEDACNRAGFDQPVAIHHIEGLLGAHALKAGWLPSAWPQPAGGARIAVVGAGPAGLSAAYFLNSLGHACHVYESREEAGGLLRWGIPAYRLPLPLLQGEVSRLERLGVRILCRTPASPDVAGTGDYQALVVSCGHTRPVTPAIPGRELFIDGLDYLRRVRSGAAEEFKGDVAVIGGGNTAVDVARTLVRCGARPVIVYRRRIEDMPAFGEEREQALAEGVALKELSAPVALRKVDGGFALDVQAMQLTGGMSEDGRARVEPVAGATETMDVQGVFAATGAEPDIACLPGPGKRTGRLPLSHCLVEGGAIPTVYSGDLASPVLSVTHAIMSGKQAAMAIDVCLKDGIENVIPRLDECSLGEGRGVSMEKYRRGNARDVSSHCVPLAEIKTHYYDRTERNLPATLAPERRVHSFDPVEAGLSKEAAMQEAGRCFNCGTCNGCGYCSIFCPEMAVELSEPNTIDLDYCKGCGICVEECPRNAMTLEAGGL
ncbi:MAG: FAD-dependent oxidoreductase [Deltaproteobacteria bacterium]|nr:FAD-dependent oxidoreductase [Deltaproteobacteria bacterium]